ncbi:hypothetical protein ABEF95_016255 [Exophiala dermatitidis]
MRYIDELKVKVNTLKKGAKRSDEYSCNQKPIGSKLDDATEDIVPSVPESRTKHLRGFLPPSWTKPGHSSCRTGRYRGSGRRYSTARDPIVISSDEESDAGEDTDVFEGFDERVSPPIKEDARPQTVLELRAGFGDAESV